ncbi:hypothetical protein CDAR_95721 [Caerostris darwini]|uniref:Uncharacterized protein n=1 Tax=Caerostris darwini TaxID=1538125 RepID=A0AAV4UQQ2_9ARAC|nr:hypothetical protein CDAR_95721 [Caerostris darwini]
MTESVLNSATESFKTAHSLRYTRRVILDDKLIHFAIQNKDSGSSYSQNLFLKEGVGGNRNLPRVDVRGRCSEVAIRKRHDFELNSLNSWEHENESSAAPF